MKSRLDPSEPPSPNRERGKASVPILGVALLIAAAGAVLLFSFAPPKRQGSDTEAATVSKSAEPRRPSQNFPVTMLSKSPSGGSNIAAAFLKSLNTNTPTGQLAARLLDESAPLKVRRAAASELARMASDEAFQALHATLFSTNSMVKASIAEFLGECPHQDAPALLSRLLDDDDEAVARGAVRGIGSH